MVTDSYLKYKIGWTVGEALSLLLGVALAALISPKLGIHVSFNYGLGKSFIEIDLFFRHL